MQGIDHPEVDVGFARARLHLHREIDPVFRKPSRRHRIQIIRLPHLVQVLQQHIRLQNQLIPKTQLSLHSATKECRILRHHKLPLPQRLPVKQRDQTLNRLKLIGLVSIEF